MKWYQLKDGNWLNISASKLKPGQVLEVFLQAVNDPEIPDEAIFRYLTSLTGAGSCQLVDFPRFADHWNNCDKLLKEKRPRVYYTFMPNERPPEQEIIPTSDPPSYWYQFVPKAELSQGTEVPSGIPVNGRLFYGGC